MDGKPLQPPVPNSASQSRQITSAEEAGFSQLIRWTPCPFARHAKWDEIPFPSDQVDNRSAAVLLATISKAGADGADMVAIQLTEITERSNVSDLAVACLAALQLLGFEAPRNGSPLREDWSLHIAGRQIFALAFAPFYPTSHPRHTPTTSSYLVLQFEESFSRHGIRTCDTRGKLSEFVERHFTQKGVAYFEAITRSSPKALRLVKPTRPNDQPVVWWSAAQAQPLKTGDVGESCPTPPPKRRM